MNVAFVKVASVPELAPGSVIEVQVNGEYYALCNVAGNITALNGTCMHRGGPLGHGHINGTRVACPWHMWEFDCRTGEYDFDPSRKQEVHAVKIEGADIFIAVP